MNKILQKSKPRGTKNNLLPAWDLSDLYQGMTDKQIEKDLAVYQKSAEAFAKKYKGKIAQLSPKQFFEMAQNYEERSVLGNK